MFRKLSLSLIIGVLSSSYSAFAQTPQERIGQPIVVNGQQVQGVYVVQNGTIQSYTCPSPQQYVTADQSSSGWACFEASTGMWLLHAQPPVQAAAPQQPSQQPPAIVYGAPTPVYVPAPAYSYAYDYYPYPYGYPYYGYPYGVGPSFGIGFGFGFRSPVIVGRPFRGGPFGRPVGPFVGSRPFGGGFRQGTVAVGRVGRGGRR